jgi:hypothetical protein
VFDCSLAAGHEGQIKSPIITVPCSITGFICPRSQDELVRRSATVAIRPAKRRDEGPPFASDVRVSVQISKTRNTRRQNICGELGGLRKGGPTKEHMGPVAVWESTVKQIVSAGPCELRDKMKIYVMKSLRLEHSQQDECQDGIELCRQKPKPAGSQRDKTDTHTHTHTHTNRRKLGANPRKSPYAEHSIYY